jgi:hypothetical protein
MPVRSSQHLRSWVVFMLRFLSQRSFVGSVGALRGTSSGSRFSVSRSVDAIRLGPAIGCAGPHRCLGR